MSSARLAAVALTILIAASSVAEAEGLNCTAFLQNRDGSWRSFNEADILGPNGPVHVGLGERLYPWAKTEKGEIARALNNLCAGG